MNSIRIVLIFINSLLWARLVLGQTPLQIPPSPNPQINTLPVPQNINTRSAQEIAKANKDIKYAEYQSICRTNNYDIENEYSRLLRSDEKMDPIREMINSRKLNEAEKFALTNRTNLGELNYTQAMILVYALKRNFIQAFSVIDNSTEAIKNDPSIKRLTALTYEQQGNFLEARILLQDLFKVSKNAELIEDLCRLSSLDSQHRDAEVSCNLGAKKLTNNFVIPIWLGISYREREMYKEAKVEFEKSLGIRTSEFALVCLAEIENLKKRKQESIEYFNKAIQFNSQSTRAHLGLANLLFELRRFDEALTHYKSACTYGKEKVDFRKAAKELLTQKSPMTEPYFQMIQKCP